MPGAEERSNKLRAGMRIESRRADAGFGGTETMDRHLIIQIVQERSVTPVRGGKLQAWRFRRRELPLPVRPLEGFPRAANAFSSRTFNLE